MDMSKYQLIIFDMDGTLADRSTGELLEGVADWFFARRGNTLGQYAIATNQGGVGLRYWMLKDGFGNPANYPTAEDVWQHIQDVIEAINAPILAIKNAAGHPVFPPFTFEAFAAYRYQSKSSGKWSPIPDNMLPSELRFWRNECRKPDIAMLEDAMKFYEVSADETLMIGDGSEDEEAAKNAGCSFVWAWEFFGRSLNYRLAT